MSQPGMSQRQVRRVERGRLAYYREAADAAFWDQHWSGMLGRGSYAEAEAGVLAWFEEPFTRYLPRTGRILEAGCGIGQHVLALRVRGYEACGVEWASRTVAAVRTLFPTLPVETGDVTALGVPDGHFAGYISLGVVEHRQEGPEPFLREAFRVLAPGGVALISVPHFHPLRRVKAATGAYQGDAEGLGFYQYAFGIREFSGLLVAAGFDVIDRWGYDGVKGLKDEIGWLRVLLTHPKHGSRIRAFLSRSRLAEQRFGHMMLFVCRKPEQVIPAGGSVPCATNTRKSPPSVRLGVFMTRGMSLKAWDDVGSLGREMALYCRLQKRGFQVTLVSYGGADEQAYAERFPGIEVLANTTGIPEEQYAASVEQIHAAALSRVDVFKSNQTNGADVALRVAQRMRRPFIARCGYMWSTNAALAHGTDSPEARHARAVEAHVFPQAEKVVVTTADMAADVMQRFPAVASRVVVIPNYVDTDNFSPDTLCEKWWDILYIGRLSPEKNLSCLLDAVGALPVRLAIIGQGPLEAALRQHPACHAGKVEWLGRVPSEELVDYIRRSRVFVLPSLIEGHPKALLEAMASGAAVVGTRVPGIANVITHERNGLLCAPTAEGIQAALQRLLADQDLARRCGAAARQFILETCALDRVVAREADLIASVCPVPSEAQAAAAPPPPSPASPEAVLDTLPDEECVNRIGAYMATRAQRGSPENGLRMLFALDDLLYSVEGGLAVRYGNGVHTKHRHTGYHEFFVNRVGVGERVLDIGCGIGAVAYDIAVRKQAQVTGIDLNAAAIAAAREKFVSPGLSFVVGDVRRIAAAGPTDVVVLSNVLEHLADRTEFLRRLVSVVRPMRLLIRVPLFERDWRMPLRKELGVEYRLDPTHETEYTRESFAREMDDAGLHITHQEIRWGEIWAECAPLLEDPVPRVSVVMATHNNSSYLPLAMESVAQQTFGDFEWILINDGSTDGTASILERYADPRLRVITHATPHGLTRSLNEALAMCRGMYIARMDGDDIALPARFERQVAFLDSHPAVGLVGTAFMYIDNRNQVSGAEPVYGSDKEIRAHLPHRNCFGHGTVMIRRDVLETVGGYDESFPYAQDYDLWLRIAEHAEVANLPEPLYCWRQSGTSISCTHTTEQEACAARAQANARARGVLLRGAVGEMSALATTGAGGAA